MTGAVIGSTIEDIKEAMDMSGVVLGSTIGNIIRKEVAMGGVVAGSTMNDVLAAQKKWGAVSINTGCNLNCPFCYLGEKVANETMAKEITEKLARYATDNWAGIVVIGTEPLLDEKSVEIVNILSSRIRTHILTNGVNLEKFSDKIPRVQRIDISLHGGPETYCRGAKSFYDIVNNAKKWKDMTGNEIYALHVLTAESCKEKNIKDMLQTGPLLGAEKTIFSPYAKTIGGSSLPMLSLGKIAKILQQFAGENWIMIIDPYHALIEELYWENIKEELSSLLPLENLLIVDFDPGDRIDRIDVHGNAHHPYIALHPGIKLPGVKLF